MKKIISFALLTCMLLSVVLPVSIYAAPALPSTVTNTSQLFNTESNTGLDAYPGTATIDGIWDENDDWSNALPLTLNSETKALIKDVGLAHSDNYANCYDGDFYLLWDETNLYILQVQRSCYATIDYATAKTTNARPWWGSTHTSSWMTRYRILPGNQTFTTGTTQCKELWTTPTRTIDADGTLAELDTSYSTVLRYHNYKYSSAAGAGTSSYGTPGGTITGVTSKFSKTSGTTHVTSYIMETSITWKYLGITAPSADATQDVVDAFGLKILAGIGDVQHLNGLNGGNAGWSGFDPITLKAEAADVEKAAAPEAIDVAAAEAYWTDAENGQFIANADATEYEISTAEQLLGLSLAMENNANDKAWTKGKTFKLTNDIDLNPNFDWTAYKNQQLNSGDTITSVSEYYVTKIAPTNVWKSLDHFYGTFDGQGHTISGVWALNGPSGTGSNGTTEWGIFAGRTYKGTQVKNVILDNGYVSASNSQVFGGLVGTYRHSLTDAEKDKNDTSTIDDGILLENIYIGKNFTVNASAVSSNKQVGGIVGSGWHTDGSLEGADYTLDVTLRNIVFGGNYIGSEECSYDGIFQGCNRVTTSNNGKNYYYNTSMINCVVTGTYTSNTNSAFNASNKVGTYTKPAEITSAMTGKFVETELGIMPVIVADMMSNYYYQATNAHDNGLYSVRIIGEIDSVKYKSVDFKVELTDADGSVQTYGYGTTGYENNEIAYNNINAGGQPLGSADFNKDMLDGEDNKMYALVIDGLNVDNSYTISVTTFWTLLDGTVVEGMVTKSVNLTPWTVES